MDTKSIFERARPIFADVLAIDESEIQPDGSLIKDYDAESIDLLDLVFRLEREFKVKIPRGQIEREARGGLPAQEFENKGKITEKGLQRLKEYLSEVPEDRFTPGMKVTEIPTLFTVETFCRVVLRAQQRQASSA